MTSIEWFWQQIKKSNCTYDDVEKLFEQAKEMHKEEIIDAWENGQDSFSSRNAEQYYQETFKKD
jgi:hypothetical protein